MGKSGGRVLVGFLGVVAAAVLIAPAAAGETVNERPREDKTITWQVGKDYMGTTRKVTPRTRRIRVMYSTLACKNPRLVRTDVVRGPRRVVVTLTVRTDKLEPGAICTALIANHRVNVDLKGRLGRRAVFDGATDPPRRRLKAPGKPAPRAPEPWCANNF